MGVPYASFPPAIALVLAGVVVLSSCKNDTSTPAAPAQNVAEKVREVANVNGQSLTEVDLLPYLLQGVDRAVATDRAINKALAAELAEREFAKETREAVAAAQRDVAAQVYLNKKAEQVGKAIVDKDLQVRYETLVKDADFNTYKVRAGVFASEQEALAGRERAMKGDKVDEKTFQNLGANGAFIGRGDLPYDLGVIVGRMKPGEYSPPVATRNGILVLHLAEVKKNERPKFEDLKPQITTLLVQERVNQSLASAREAARITLK